MSTKKYVSLERLADYDALIKQEIVNSVSGKADSGHSHDDKYYTENEVDEKIDNVNESISDIVDGTVTVANATKATSADTATTANHSVSSDSATTATSATKDGSGNTITSTYETKSDASNKLTEAKTYADNAATKVKNDLLNGASGAYDTLKELGDLIDDNVDAIDALEAVAAGKADKSHTHTISNVTNLQESLDDKISKTTSTDLGNGVSLRFTQYGNRHVTINGNEISADMSGETGGWSGNFASVKDPSGDTTTMLGWYGGADSLYHIFMGGSYSDPYMKMTKGGQFTFKNMPDVAGSPMALKSEVDAKANASHSHAISDVSGLQNVLNAKATQTSLDTHIGDTTKHITSTERTNWNAAKTHADTAHAPSNAEKNQNAFSNVVVGSTTIAADSTTDTLTLVAGTNVTITPDANGDKITIAATDTNTTYDAATQSAAGLMSAADKKKLDGIATGANNYTYTLPAANSSALGGVKVGSNITNSNGTISLTKANVTAALGYTPPTSDTNTTYSAGTGISLSGTTFSNSGVRSISTGTTNGTISVNTNGSSANVAVKGLGSAAYTDSNSYAPSLHYHTGNEIKPCSIELIPIAAQKGNGGFIDFHYNASGSPSQADYTSRIIEESTGIGIVHSDGHSGKILVSSNITALYNVAVTFSSGKATYTNSAIKSSSVCIVQRRSGTAGSATTSMYATTSNNGSLTIVTDNTSATTVNLNIFIFNL